MNNFIDLLKRAFTLWWRARALWPLGMLAALVGSGDASVGGNFNISQPLSGDAEPELPPWLTDVATSPLVRDLVANPLPYVVGLILAVIALAMLSALVGALAHAAMIRVADMTDQGAETGIGDGLRIGVARMGPIFLLNLVLALPVIVVVAIAGAIIGASIAGALGPLIAGDQMADPAPLIATFFGLFFCALGLIMVLWVLGALLGIWSRVAQRVCVLEAKGPLASLGRAWQLIIRNLGLIVLTWIFQGVLGAVVSFVLAIPALALALPAMMTVLQNGTLPIGLLVALFLYAIAASVLLGGLLTAFNSTTWTVMYRAFVAREQPFVSYGPG